MSMGDTIGLPQRGKNAHIWSPSVLLRDKALLWFYAFRHFWHPLWGRLCVLLISYDYGRLPITAASPGKSGMRRPAG